MSLISHIQTHKQNAVFWLIGGIFSGTSKEDPDGWSAAVAEVSRLLSLIEDPVKRNAYVQRVCKLYEIKLKDFNSAMPDDPGEEDGENGASNWPDWLKEDKQKQYELYKFGFVEKNSDPFTTGYWFMDGAKIVKQTNFIIQPLYHIYGRPENRRMFSLCNGNEKHIVEIPSKNMLSTELFQAKLWDEGNFDVEPGFNKYHLTKIRNKYGSHFKFAHELNNLGWQIKEGFFAFANVCYRPAPAVGEKGVLTQYDEFGVVEVDQNHYLSPSKNQSHARERNADDIYENDNFLSYQPSQVSFEEWCNLMVQVYDRHAWMGIAFSIATLFRDVIIKIARIPHLYAYGDVGAGKSEFTESISNLFFSGKDSKGELYKPMNLSQGTEYAFWNRMERFYNCPNALNELDDDAIEDYAFGGIKSAYDGQGREKGSGKNNKSISQKVNCTLLLAGQRLTTRDGNSVLTRCIPILFLKIKAGDRPQHQIEAHARLKKLEDQGVNSVLCDLMDLRPIFQKRFSETFAAVQRRVIDDFKTEGVSTETRILKNVACLITTVKLASEQFKFPFTYEEFFNHSKSVVKQLTNLIVNTSGIADFWSMLEYLLDRGMINYDDEFNIKSTDKITLVSESESERSDIRTFVPEKKVLYLRLSAVHKLYQVECKRMGKMPLPEATLMSYFKSEEYYFGQVKTWRFKKRGKNGTSCYAFDYEKLGISLERGNHSDERTTSVFTGEIISELTQVAGTSLFKFVMRSYNQDESRLINSSIYYCFTDNQLAQSSIIKGYKIHLVGELQIIDDKVKNIDVKEFEAVPNYEQFKESFSGEKPVDKPVTEQTNIFQAVRGWDNKNEFGLES